MTMNNNRSVDMVPEQCAWGVSHGLPPASGGNRNSRGRYARLDEVVSSGVTRRMLDDESLPYRFAKSGSGKKTRGRVKRIVRTFGRTRLESEACVGAFPCVPVFEQKFRYQDDFKGVVSLYDNPQLDRNKLSGLARNSPLRAGMLEVEERYGGRYWNVTYCPLKTRIDGVQMVYVQTGHYFTLLTQSADETRPYLEIPWSHEKENLMAEVDKLYSLHIEDRWAHHTGFISIHQLFQDEECGYTGFEYLELVTASTYYEAEHWQVFRSKIFDSKNWSLEDYWDLEDTDDSESDSYEDVTITRLEDGWPSIIEIDGIIRAQAHVRGARCRTIGFARKIVRDYLEYPRTKLESSQSVVPVSQDVSSVISSQDSKVAAAELELVARVHDLFSAVDPSRVLSRLEDSLLIGCALFSTRSWVKVVCLVVFTLRGSMDKGLLENLVDAVVGYIESSGTSFRFSTFVHSVRTNTGLGSLKRLLSYVLVPFVHTGVLSRVEIEGLALGSDEVSAVSFVEAVAGTLDYLQGALDVFSRTGSFAGFITENYELVSFSRNASSFIVQSREVISSSVAENHKTLAKLIQDGKQMLDSGKNLIPVVPDKLRPAIRTNCLEIAQCIRVLNTKITAGKFKEEPFTILVVGRSHVGKSKISDYLNRHVVLASGEEYCPERKASVRGDEKFKTNIRDDTQSIMVDDLSNVHHDKAQTSPLDCVLRWTNNVRTPEDQASIERKENAGVAATSIVCTSNIRDCNAKYYTEEPASIMTRLHVTIFVELRPEYRTPGGTFDSSKANKDFSPTEISDCWLLSAYKPQVHHAPLRPKVTFEDEDKHEPSSYKLVPVRHKGRSLEQVSIMDVMEWLFDNASEHFGLQRSIVLNQDIYDHSKAWCVACNKARKICQCPVELGGRNESGIVQELAVRGIHGVVEDTLEKWSIVGLKKKNAKFSPGKALWNIAGFQVNSEEFSLMVLDKCRLIADILENSCVFHYLTWVPEGIYSTELGLSSIDVSSRSYIRRGAIAKVLRDFGLRVCSIMGTLFFVPIVGPAVLFVAPLSGVIDAQKNAVFQIISSALNAGKNLYVSVTGVYASKILEVIKLVAGFFALKWLPVFVVVFWWYISFSVSLMSPLVFLFASYFFLVACRKLVFGYSEAYDTIKYELCAKIEKVRSRVKAIEPILPSGVSVVQNALGRWEWTRVEEGTLIPERYITAKDVPIVSKKCSSIELINVISDNVVSVNNGREVVNGLVLKTGYILLPSHFLYKDEQDLTIIRYSRHRTPDFAFHQHVRRKDITRVSALDLCVVKVSGGPLFKDIVNIFPVTKSELVAAGEGVLVHREQSGVISVRNLGGMKTKVLTTTAVDFVTGGLLPKFEAVCYEGETEKGDCGSPIIVAGNVSYIAGIHILSKTNVLGKRLYGAAIQVLQQDILNAIQQCDVPFSLPRLETEIPVLGPPVTQSSVSYLEEDVKRDFEYLGRIGGYSKFQNKVFKSEIFEILRTEGWADEWGSPTPEAGNLKNYTSSQKWIEAATRSSRRVDDVLLERAVRDYIEPFLDGDPLIPLTRREIVNGKYGSRFVKGMDMATSAGWPHCCQKSALATQDDRGLWQFDRSVWDNYAQSEHALMEGRRLFEPGVVSNKMEVRERIDTDHVKPARKFQNMCLNMNIAMRKYFLPVINELLERPELSEMAVGINPYSKDWARLHSFIVRPWRRYHATDYSGFDQSIPNQALSAFLCALIEIAQARGYSPKDVSLMRALASCVVYPILIMDGDVYQLNNMMCSGIVGTSVLDGGITCLLKRVHFMSMYPSLSFRSNVSLMTFGDDVIESVSWFLLRYNQRSYANFVSHLGMKITSASKDTNLTNSVLASDLTFLKRSFRYSQDHGCVVAPLAEKSIRKSLMYYVASKYVSPSVVLSTNLDRALVEISLHGRDKFSSFSAIVEKLPEKLTSQMRFFGKSYDEIVELYKMQYLDIFNLTFGERLIFETPDEGTILESGTMENTGVGDDIGSIMKLGDPDVERIVKGQDVTTDTYESDITLSRFFERPVPIVGASFSLGAKGVVHVDNYPYKYWIANKRVVNRICNIKNIRGDLRLEIVINTTPFVYGRLLFAVEMYPFGAVTQNLGTYSLPALSEASISWSQCPSVYIDLGTTTRACIDIPMCWASEWYDVPGNDFYTHPVRMILMSLTPIQSAKEDTVSHPVGQFRIFASMRNVKVKGITGANPTGVVVQMGMVGETLSGAASVAGSLSSIPGIGGTMAKASTVAKKLGEIADVFGFSRDVPSTGGSLMVPGAVGYIAQGNLDDVVYKLSLDQRQEISIGSVWSPSENNPDPLAFSTIARKPSYLLTIPWTESRSTGSRLQYIAVAPDNMFEPKLRIGTPPCVYDYAYTSLAIPTLFMRQWSGSIMFRITAVCSPYHQGSVVITYDPHTSKVTPEYNLMRSVILDIGARKSVTVMIPMCQSTTYLVSHKWEKYYEATVPGTIPASKDPISTSGSAEPIVNNYAGYAPNGYLSFYVLNILSSPNPNQGSPVSLVVEVFGCDDMRFSDPWDRYVRLFPSDTVTSAPALMAEEVEETILEVGMSECSDMVVLGDGECQTPGVDTLFMGETISGFRELANRYVLHTTIEKDNTDTAYYTYVFKFYGGTQPYTQGPYVGSADPIFNSKSGPGTTNYKWYNSIPANFIMWMFAGYMGSVRHAFIVSAQSGLARGLYVERFYSTMGGLFYSEIAPFDINQKMIYGSATHGGALCNYGTSMGLKVEFPPYSRYLMWSGRNWNYPVTENNFGTNYDGVPLYLLSAIVSPNADGSDIVCSDYIAMSNIRVCGYMGLPYMRYKTLPVYVPP